MARRPRWRRCSPCWCWRSSAGSSSRTATCRMSCRTSARPCRAITWFSSAGTRWRAARSAWRTCWPSPPGRWPSAWSRSGAGARRAPPPEVLPGMMVDMGLISRSKPGPEPSAGDDLDTGVTGLLRYRRLVIRVLLAIFLLLPVVTLLRSHHHPGGHPGFLIPAALVFVVLVDRTVLVRMPEPGRYARWQWLLLPIVVALGAAMFAVGGMGWLTALAVASAGVGRITPDGRATVLGLVCCTGIAVAIGIATGLSY